MKKCPVSLSSRASGSPFPYRFMRGANQGNATVVTGVWPLARYGNRLACSSTAGLFFRPRVRERLHALTPCGRATVQSGTIR